MLTLIAIAKNEAAEIEAFLRHHEDLFDECVVVDTGSTDGTAELARRCGARVIDFEWRDDFAAARNASLRAATGDWAFVLDIDERIAPGDFARVRAAARGPRRAYLCQQRNYYDRPEHQEWQPVQGEYPQLERYHTGYFAAEQFRLLPVDPGLNWTGCVHEDLSPSLQQRGVKLATLHVPIHHYGYVRTDEHNRTRNEYYGRLARRKVAENPDDRRANLELAYALIQEGNARESMPILEKLSGDHGGDRSVCRMRLLLAKMYHEDGRPSEALALLERAVNDHPRWIFAWTSWIGMLLAEKEHERAEAALIRAKERFPDTTQLLRHECQLLVNTRRIVEAIPIARRVTELMPNLPEYAALADKCEDLARRTGRL